MRQVFRNALAVTAIAGIVVLWVYRTEGADSSAPSLSAQVYSIFEAKCVECHGADLLRPKGHFGYVLDLRRVAANPKMVVPGTSAKSELYKTVFFNEMPGEGATSPPLTDEEKEIVKRWIDSGATVDIPPPAAADPLPLGKRIVRLIGQFHPPSSHFPIALLIVAFPAEFIWKATRKPSWKAVVRFCVVLGAACAAATAALGWCDALFSPRAAAATEVLGWHRWLGTATALWAVATAILSEYAHREGHPRALRYCFRLSLLVGIICITATGYLGASLIYGLSHYRW